MNLPGFTSEASIYRNRSIQRLLSNVFEANQAVIPAANANCTTTQDSQYVCDGEYTYFIDDCYYQYSSFEDCDQACYGGIGCCNCQPETECVVGHYVQVPVTECTGPCTGWGWWGSSQTISAFGRTQTCHSNWFYGWYPYITNTNGAITQGCRVCLG